MIWYIIFELPFNLKRIRIKRYIKEDKFPIIELPKPYFILHKETSIPVARPQDIRIFDLAKKKRYSDYNLNPQITGSPIAVLNGAGFSAALNFPTMSGFRKDIPDWIVETLNGWLANKKDMLDYVWNDFEILMDLLLRIQRIAILNSDNEIFLEHLSNLQDRLESIFVFKEQYFDFWTCYPPLTHLQAHVKFISNTKTAHFRTIRKIIYEVLKAMLMKCYKIETNYLEF